MRTFQQHHNESNKPAAGLGDHFIQPKLKIGRPDDKYEREADRVADTVMRMPDSPVQMQPVEEEEEEQLQMQPVEEEEEKLQMAPEEPHSQQMCPRCQKRARQGKPLDCLECEKKLQMKQALQQENGGHRYTSPEISSQLSASRGQGASLPGSVQHEMTRKMGADFSNVHIHTDSKSHLLNQQLGAKAFTHGSNIYFNKGEYNPSSKSGKHLLAHELTHVVQQGKQQSSGLIQRLTCQEEYGPPGLEPEPNALSSQRGAAITRLRTNLNSWDAYLISEVESIANGLFSTEEELAWWSNWAVGLAVDLIDEAIPKPIGTLIKAFASAGEHIANKSIAEARAQLAKDGRDAVIAYRTRQSNEGETYIYQYYERLRSRTDESCAGYTQLLLDSIDKWWPQLDTSTLQQAQSLAHELMNQVRAKHTLERLRREYEQCVEYALYRPGGIPTEEEECRAREDCRRETGYYPITAC